MKVNIATPIIIIASLTHCSPISILILIKLYAVCNQTAPPKYVKIDNSVTIHRFLINNINGINRLMIAIMLLSALEKWAASSNQLIINIIIRPVIFLV